MVSSSSPEVGKVGVSSSTEISATSPLVPSVSTVGPGAWMPYGTARSIMASSSTNVTSPATDIVTIRGVTPQAARRDCDMGSFSPARRAGCALSEPGGCQGAVAAVRTYRERMDEREQWRRMLESVLGPEAAEEAMRALEAGGADPAEWAKASGIADNPQALAAAMAQMQQILQTDDGGESDWRFAHDVARQAANTGGDPSVTSAQAAKVRSTLTVADLWLDAATDLPPSGGPQVAASRADWVERTLPTWRAAADPIGVSVATRWRVFSTTSWVTTLSSSATRCPVWIWHGW